MVIDAIPVRLKKLDLYIELMEKFVSGSVTLSQFESAYFELFKNDETMWADAEFCIIGGLFSDLDSWYPDAHLRDLGDLDDEQMRTRIPAALGDLKTIVGNLEDKLDDTQEED